MRTAFSAVFVDLLVKLLAGGALGLEDLVEGILVVGHLAEQGVELVVDLLVDDGLRQSEIGLAPVRRLRTSSRMAAACSPFLASSTWDVMDSRSSSAVSNSEAIWANSSSNSGSLPLLGLLHGGR